MLKDVFVEKKKETDVLISGAGPVGLLTANLLGQQGVDVLLVERRSEMYTYARAVGIDDEALRALHAAGLYERFTPYLQYEPTIEYLSLNGYRFFSPKASMSFYGYPFLATFFQPHLENLLRENLKRHPSVKFIASCELTHFHPHHQTISTYLTHQKEQLIVHSKYLLACDGGRSLIRKLLGLNLMGDSKSQFWLVVDTKDSQELAKQITQHHQKESKRPMVTISLPGGLRRFECMLSSEERDMDTLNAQEISSLFSPFIGDFQLEIHRQKTYERYYRYADTFQKGNVFLLGDAAHMIPPYGGQGLCSGLRDALNISWKLGVVIKNNLCSCILKSYESERKYHMMQIVKFVKTLSRQVENPLPSQKISFSSPKQVESNYRPVKPEAAYQRGLFFKSSPYSGKMFSPFQVCNANGTSVRLDDAFEYRFAVLGWGVDVHRLLSESDQLIWKKLHAAFFVLSTGDSWPKFHNGFSIPLFAQDDGWKRYFSDQRTVLILRPDKFILAACHHGQMSTMTKKIKKLFQISNENNT